MIWGFAGISGSFLVAASRVDPLHTADSVYRLTFSQRAPRNARPHEVGEGRTVRLRWFHAGIHVLHGRVCLTRTALAPAVGRPARCTVTLPGDTGSVGDAVPHQQQASSRIWLVVASPTRVLQAQITQRCTRYVAMHPIRRGAMPTDRVHRLIDDKLVRGFARWRRPRRRPTGPGRAALHQIQQQCTR